MSPILIASHVAAVLVAVALCCVTWRLLRGPSAADRAIAVDMLGLIAIVVAAVTAAVADHQGYLDVAFGIALFGFLTAVALAGLLERVGARRAAEPDDSADGR